MQKRVLSLFVTLMLIFSTSVPSAAAQNAGLRSSPTLASYIAKVSEGSVPGNVIISYDVTANTLAEEVGVSTIKVYDSSDKCVATITGSWWNGLIATNTERHRSSYTYKGESGTTYYAVVTVFATIGGVSDSRDYTTKTVTAP